VLGLKFVPFWICSTSPYASGLSGVEFEETLREKKLTWAFGAFGLRELGSWLENKGFVVAYLGFQTQIVSQIGRLSLSKLPPPATS
jgi:hypothetical protein